MIKLTDVTREFPRGGRALEDVTIHIRKGEFVFLTGHSGAGKTTALRLIHLADRPTSGEVRVSGFSSRRTPDREVWKLRRKVGFVFQDFRLLEDRTAAENLAFVLEVTGTRRREIRSRTQRLLSQVGLSTKSGSAIHELSGGEQQRLAIARALATEPIILLADEPTGNLDERATRGILDLLENIHTMGTLVVIATHDMELVRRHREARVIELDQGRVVYDSGDAG